MGYRLPMFPLGMPLLPGRLLPLRIFEPRYVALLRQCLQHESPEFGVVLIERGFEVGGGEQRSMIGTVAGILEAVPRPAGDFSVISFGRRRIRVLEWLADDPHPWARVEDWPDTDQNDIDGVNTDGRYRQLIEESVTRVRDLLSLAGAGLQEHEILDRLVESVETAAPTQMSFALAGLVPFGAADEYRILRCSGVLERLQTMQELFDDLEAVIKFHQAEDPTN